MSSMRKYRRSCVALIRLTSICIKQSAFHVMPFEKMTTCCLKVVFLVLHFKYEGLRAVYCAAKIVKSMSLNALVDSAITLTHQRHIR